MDSVNRPFKILSTLDSLLHQDIELVIIGRSAIALGYESSYPKHQLTMDVDSVIPNDYISVIESNEDFWQANEKLNELLSDEGLYFTHIFEESQIILRHDWYQYKVGILNDQFKFIQLYRPHTIDLILTKMMRNDPEDMEDISFLLKQLHREDIFHLEQAIQNARVPQIVEIQELFQRSIIQVKGQINLLDEI